MSFLLDPGLLVASGVAIECVVPDEHKDTAELATIATFLGISTALYANAPGLGLFWKPFRSENGRDFMLNSGVFHFRAERPGWRTHAVAFGIFASYPLWLRAGRQVAARARRRRADVGAVEPSGSRP
jgi:hypothetical protein